MAKYDLETRGPGDFFGAAQHGLPTLRVADLVQDTKTLRVAQDEAKALLAKDPNLIDRPTVRSPMRWSGCLRPPGR